MAADPRDEAIRRDVLAGRGFSLAEAIGREGGEFLKGVSPVPPLVQTRLGAKAAVDRHLRDPSRALQLTLERWIDAEDALLSRHLGSPLDAVVALTQRLLERPEQLYELVWQTDMR